MRGKNKAGIAIGVLAGGLLGYLLSKDKPWATTKKVAAVAVGAAGGGAIGYGISKMPSGGRALAHG